MSKFSDQSVHGAFQAYLQPGESLANAAYAGYRPFYSYFFGILGMRALTRVFMVGLTNRRVIILHLTQRLGDNIQVKSFRSYDLTQLPPISTQFGSFATALRINDPAIKFTATFAAEGVPNNYQRGQMICKEVQARWQSKGVAGAFPETVVAPPMASPTPASPPATQSAAVPAPVLGASPVSTQYRPQQSSTVVYGCLSAALIAFGSFMFLLGAAAMIGMVLDHTKTNRETVGGVVGGVVIFLFSAVLIGTGIFILRMRRKQKTQPVVSS
ncbi:MAG TPA: hypothetical protein VGQ72_06660 [Pyrinomonadaceae bacterium]|nr:hypothetical protein [Pyrinomonadaceae bacterium]